jgi:hypothetical protein
MTTYILWERANDFINGQVMEDGAAVAWAREDTISGNSNLNRLLLSSSIVQTRYASYIV